ncbi:MAG: hypothetical protein LW696_06845 [Alphaproteobacteria bacterium]|jgi:hypothetical protein|nr:hypothetical protein [Alphaproteobacteria bacterium]
MESAAFFMLIKGTTYHRQVDKAIDETAEFRIAVGAKLEESEMLIEYKKAPNKEEILRAFQNLLQCRFSLLNQTLQISSGVTPYGEFTHYFPNADMVKNHFVIGLIEILDGQLPKERKMLPLLKEEFEKIGTWAEILHAFGDPRENNIHHKEDGASSCLPRWLPFNF